MRLGNLSSEAYGQPIGEQKANIVLYFYRPCATLREVPLSSRVGAAAMDEGRKRVLLIAASILAARKLAQYDGGARVPATICAIADAIRWAEQIMAEIDRRWPVKARGSPD
jgi:hypothetical protein